MENVILFEIECLTQEKVEQNCENQESANNDRYQPNACFPMCAPSCMPNGYCAPNCCEPHYK